MHNSFKEKYEGILDQESGGMESRLQKGLEVSWGEGELLIKRIRGVSKMTWITVSKALESEVRGDMA